MNRIYELFGVGQTDHGPEFLESVKHAKVYWAKDEGGSYGR